MCLIDGLRAKSTRHIRIHSSGVGVPPAVIQKREAPPILFGIPNSPIESVVERMLLLTNSAESFPDQTAEETMSDFEGLFIAAQSDSIFVNGEELFAVSRISVDNNDTFLVRFEKFGSQWKQGVVISWSRKKSKSLVIVDGKSFKLPLAFWQDTTPSEFCFSIQSKGPEELGVCNVWDDGSGIPRAWKGGAAMKIEKIENGSRYRCNDGQNNDDFDDIIFTIQKLD